LKGVDGEMDNLSKIFNLILLVITGSVIVFGGLYVFIRSVGKAPKIDPDYLSKGKK
jgi:hypothetical protein